MKKAEREAVRQLRLMVTRRVIERGGTLREAADLLGMDPGQHHRLCKSAGFATRPRMDWAAVFGQIDTEAMTAYEIGKLIGRDPTDVRRAAHKLGIRLRRKCPASAPRQA
jgi:hypothetical protein